MISSADRSHPGDLFLPLIGAAALLFVGRALLPRPETIDSLEARLRRHPTSAVYHQQLADLLAQAKRPDEAVAHYRAALQFDPGNVAAPCGLAQTLAAAGSTLEAQRILEKSLRLHPEDARTNEALADLVVKSLGDFALPSVKKYYEAAVRADPTRANAALQLSRIYLAEGRETEAGRVVRAALPANDRNSALHLQMANIYTLLGRYDQAGVEYSVGTARDPDNADAWCAWGKALIAAKSPDDAEKKIRHAIKLKPDVPLYHVQLAIAVRDQGRYADSREEFIKALDLDPRNVAVFLEESDVYHNLHDDRTAMAILRRCMEVNLQDLRPRVKLAALLTNAEDPLLRDLAQAAELYQSCVDATSEPDAALLAAAADGWARIKQYDRALELIEQALTLATLTHLPVEQHESLLDRRQRYLLDSAPPLPETERWLGIPGLNVPQPGDKPWAPLPQPSIDVLSRLPSRLGESPGPGAAFDPELFHGDAVKRQNQIGIRP